MASLDRYRATLARSRSDALITARRERLMREAGGDERVGLEAAAVILGCSPQHTQRLFKRGEVFGAHVEKRRWRIRKRDLWTYMGLEVGELGQAS